MIKNIAIYEGDKDYQIFGVKFSEGENKYFKLYEDAPLKAYEGEEPKTEKLFFDSDIFAWFENAVRYANDESDPTRNQMLKLLTLVEFKVNNIMQ